jgi:hypothetical protein
MNTTEDEHESSLFRHIMSGARKQENSLRELCRLTNGLAGANNDTMTALSATSVECPLIEEAQPYDMDDAGNPCWISLPAQEQTPKNALPRPVKLFSKNSERQSAKQPQPLAHLRNRAAQDADYPQADGAPPLSFTRRIRPMRGFFRMLIVAIILGLAYYFLSQKGWVQRLF